MKGGERLERPDRTCRRQEVWGAAWQSPFRARSPAGLGPQGGALEGALAGAGLGTQPEVSVFHPQVTVLVMCHTRELAFQISKEYERFSKYMPSVKVSARRLGGLRGLLQRCCAGSGSGPAGVHQAWPQWPPLRFAAVYAP